MEQKCGKVMEEKEKYENDSKRGENIMLYGKVDALPKWLNANGYKDFKEIEAKLEECNTKLKSRNEDIDKIMEQKCGKVMEEKEKYENDSKRGENIMLYGKVDALPKWLNANGYKDFKEIEAKLEECNTKLKMICSEEEKEKSDNKIEINKLSHINIEVGKLLESEN
eukprot:177904_1